jgi:hypothetical protein
MCYGGFTEYHAPGRRDRNRTRQAASSRAPRYAPPRTSCTPYGGTLQIIVHRVAGDLEITLPRCMGCIPHGVWVTLRTCQKFL